LVLVDRKITNQNKAQQVKGKKSRTLLKALLSNTPNAPRERTSVNVGLQHSR
jgi:hypothetical protein